MVGQETTVGQNAQIGLKGIATKWFMSYLSDGIQIVEIIYK